MEKVAETTYQTVIDGHDVNVTYKMTRDNDWSAKYRRARAYIWYPTEAFCGEHPPYSMKGDDPANDKAWRQFNRKEVAAMRNIMDVVGLDVPEWRFSRKAGCSCPCSPGFIRKSWDDANHDYYITVTLAD